MGHNPPRYSATRHGPILTIGQAAAARRTLWAFCRNCAKSTELDAFKLSQKAGSRDTPLEDLAKRLRCRRCLNAEAILIPAEGFAHGG